MALTKDKHYWTQLRTAVTAGQWDSDLPGKDQKGNPLSWANLLRKFNKHCPGQNEFAEVVSQTHHLFLQLAAGRQKSAIGAPQHSQTNPLDLGDDIILPEERQQEGRAGYDVLNAIPSPSEVSPVGFPVYFRLNQNPKSTQLALAYYAYSLSLPSESHGILSKIKDLTHPLKRISASKSVTSASNASQTGADQSSVSSWAGTFSAVEHTQANPDVKDGRAWSSVETVRSVCLKGTLNHLCDRCAITFIPRNVIREAASVRSAGVARYISFRLHPHRDGRIRDPSHRPHSRPLQPPTLILHSVSRTLEMGRTVAVENNCHRRSDMHRRTNPLCSLPPILRL